jgi:hypothetical protein
MIYAQIQNDIVISIFGCPQDPEVWPGVVELDVSDPRVVAYVAQANLKTTNI